MLESPRLQPANRIRLALVSVVCIFLATGCGSDNLESSLPAETRFAAGMKKFLDEDYLDSIDDFKAVALQFQGSAVADDAQYYMAEARYQRGEYILAAYEYEILLRTMPTSEFGSRARYQRAMCYYQLSPRSFLDQDYSKKAIDEFQAFIEYYPTDSLVTSAEKKIMEMHNKLGKKEFDNGVIYMKMEYYKAATVYFDLVLEKYHDTEYAERALYYKVEALVYRKRYPEAKEAVELFLSKYATSALRGGAMSLQKEILEMIEKAQSASVNQKIPDVTKN
jgi:outer membrane protein assembly factor BamD